MTKEEEAWAFLNCVGLHPQTTPEGAARTLIWFKILRDCMKVVQSSLLEQVSTERIDVEGARLPFQGEQEYDAVAVIYIPLKTPEIFDASGTGASIQEAKEGVRMASLVSLSEEERERIRQGALQGAGVKKRRVTSVAHARIQIVRQRTGSPEVPEHHGRIGSDLDRDEPTDPMRPDLADRPGADGTPYGEAL